MFSRIPYRRSQIFDPAATLSMFQIMAVLFVQVGLFFKGYIAIGATFEKETNEPFNQVPQVKKDVEHLFHLRRMDGFVTKRSCGDFDAFGGNQQTEKVDGGKPAREKNRL